MTTPQGSKPGLAISGSNLLVRSRSLTISLSLLLAAFCLSSPVKAQERAIGHVLHVEGKWYLDGQRAGALSQGDPVPAGGVIRIPFPSNYSSIVIRYSDNSQSIVKKCRNPGECQQPILLPRAVRRPASATELFLEKYIGRFRRNPVRPSSNAGRSSDGVLREAVVQLKAGQVDLAPVFGEMNPGTYDVRLERRMVDGKMAKVGSAKALKVKWDSEMATTNPAVNLEPGLYEMVLLEKRGSEFKPTLTTAWFLAGNLDQYAQTVGPFCEATQVTARWKDDVSEGTAKDFLRSFLIHLESQSQRAQPAK